MKPGKLGGDLIIIGVDPGSKFTGFGVISQSNEGLKHLEHGVVETPQERSFAERLADIAGKLFPVFERWPGACTAVERVFLGKNPDSAFKLGHARGVCLMVAGKFRSPVFEYAARKVKKVVTGHGGAEKEHVRVVVSQLLQIPLYQTRLDASDALALAICHAQEAQIEERLKRLKEAKL